MFTDERSQLTKSGTPVWVYGDGPPVVLVHGVMVDHRMWRPQVEALSPHYRLFCMDMLGHGRAPDPAGERSLADFVEQVREVVELASELQAPVLAGFSMGGLVAQAYAVRYHASLAGLVLMNAVYDRSPQQAATVWARYEANVADGPDNAVRSGMARWFTDEERRTHTEIMADVGRWLRAGDFAAKCKAHRVFVTSDHQLTGKLGGISCPTLVMTGERDNGSTPEMSRKIAAAIPDSECRILEGQHHMMTLLDAERVNGILLGFLPRCFPVQ